MSAKANLLSLSCLLVVALIGYGTATLTAQPQPLGDVSVRVFNSVPQVVGDFYTPLTFDSELWDTAN